MNRATHPRRHFVFHCISCGWGFSPAAARSRFCPRCGEAVRQNPTFRRRQHHARTHRITQPDLRPARLSVEAPTTSVFGLSRSTGRTKAAKAWNTFVAVVEGCRARPLVGGASLVVCGAVAAIAAQAVLVIATYGVFLCAAALICTPFMGGQSGRRGEDRTFEAGLNGFAWSMLLGLAAMAAGILAQVVLIAGTVLFVGRLAFLAYQRRQQLAETGKSFGLAVRRRCAFGQTQPPPR